LIQGRLRIHKLKNVLLGVTHGAGESKLRVHVTGDGNNIVLLGAGQFILRGDNFDIVGRAGLKAILGKRKFALRKLLPLPSDTDLLSSGIEIQERLADILIDAALEIGDLVVDTFDAAGELLSLAAPVAIEDGKVDLALNQARGLDAADAAAKFSDVAVQTELWIEAGAVGALLL
jgi:hypothetical protein